MTENKFLYFITDKDGKSFYVEDNLVQKQGQPRELLYAPDGFQDQSIEYKRDSKWFGVFRNFSFPLGFVMDGKEIIKYIRYKLGYEFRAFLNILIIDFFINDTQFGFGYKPYYKGEFDLTTVKKSESKIEVNLLDGGIEAMMRANENTEYTLPLNANHVIVKQDGIVLKQNATYEIPEIEMQGLAANATTPMFIVEKEGFGVNATVKDQEGGILNSEDYFVYAVETITFSLNMKVRWKMNNKVDSAMLFLERRKGAAHIGYIYNSGILSEKNHIYEANISQTITLNAGEHLWLHCLCSGTLQSDWKITYEKTSARIDYDSPYKTTYTKAKTAYQTGVELVEKMTDGKYGFYSPYLEKRTDLVLTSGDGLRNFDEAKIKISFADYFQWLWCNEDLYVGITIITENNKQVKKVVIDELRYQFQFTDTIIYIPITQQPVNNPILNGLNKTTDLGFVRNLELETDAEKLFNRIKVGCPNQNYDDINGRTEFNSTQHWSAPIVRSEKELDLTTSVREDAMGVEWVRANLDGKQTTDSSSDNDTFALHVQKKSVETYNGRPLYLLDRSETITGVISPDTHFNAWFSPKHKLTRKKRFLKSCLYGVEGYLKLTQAEKNADVAFNSVSERQDIPLTALGEPYFTPDLLKFETPYPLNLIELQNSGDLKRNCFKISWNSKNYYGFLHTVSIQPWMNEVQTLTLISSPKNDLSTI